MKKVLSLFACLLLVLTSLLPVSAARGNVTYTGDSGSIIFAPGSNSSPTDLFSNFKDVMPGDSLMQRITVRNDASKNVKVKVYVRAKGAQSGSTKFLSKLHLRVQKSENNEMAYMFDAQANETAQLTEWVLLGTLYSGGEVNLDVYLDVPVELDNTYANQIGYLDWEFMIEEFPVEDTDPQPPQTGDDFHLIWWLVLLVISATALFILIVSKKRKKL